MTSLAVEPPVVGTRLPRVASVPPHADQARGVEAVEFARRFGLVLDDWQADVLRQACATRPDGTWAAFEVACIVARQNGKGSILEARELAGLFLFDEALILHSAHEFKTAAEAFRRVLSWVDNHDELRSLVSRVRTSHGEEGIELRNGNRLRFVARSTGSGRGFTGDTIIMDESYALGAEAMGALLPTLSARPNPQLWYTSSAGMLKSSQLRAVRDRGRAGADPHLAYFEWSAEPDADPDDPASWAAANPALGGRISVDFVARERQALPDGEFARERLGWWEDPEVAGTDIASEPWEALADPSAAPGDPVVLAFDVSPGFASAAVVACGTGRDGRPVVEVVEHAPGTSWLVARLAGLQHAHGAGAVAFDPSGPAGSLQPELAAAGVAVDVMSAQRTTQACGAFIAAVTDGQLVHRGERALTDAAVAGRRRTSGDAARWSRRDSTVDICPLVAATIARHAWAERGDPEPGVFVL